MQTSNKTWIMPVMRDTFLSKTDVSLKREDFELFFNNCMRVQTQLEVICIYCAHIPCMCFVVVGCIVRDGVWRRTVCNVHNMLIRRMSIFARLPRVLRSWRLLRQVKWLRPPAQSDGLRHAHHHHHHQHIDEIIVFRYAAMKYKAS